jgi:hypothetical protein
MSRDGCRGSINVTSCRTAGLGVMEKGVNAALQVLYTAAKNLLAARLASPNDTTVAVGATAPLPQLCVTEWCGRYRRLHVLHDRRRVSWTPSGCSSTR